MKKTSAIVLSVVFMGAAMVAMAQEPSVGKVVSLEGSADVTRGDGGEVLNLAVNDEVFRLDSVRTKKESFLEIELNDGSSFTLDESTKVEISQYVTNPEADSLLSMARGRLRATVGRTFSSRRESFRVQSSDAVMGVQGTDFLVDARLGRTEVIVFEGLVSVTSLDPNYPAPQILRAGQSIVVEPGVPLPQPADYFPINDADSAEAPPLGSGSSQDVQSGGTQVQDPTSVLPPPDAPEVTVPPTPNPPDGDGG